MSDVLAPRESPGGPGPRVQPLKEAAGRPKLPSSPRESPGGPAPRDQPLIDMRGASRARVLQPIATGSRPGVRLNDAPDGAPVGGRIQPRAVSGRYTRWRWAMAWITQLVFFGLPWLMIDGTPLALFDLDARRFHLLGAVFYLQDFVYLTGAMVIAALTLFLSTSVAGRVWCGYACPQSVYTMIFRWIERRVEGDRNARMKLDRAPRAWRTLRLRLAKHALWLAFSGWTGVTFVAYFIGIRPLLAELAAFDAGLWSLAWIGIYGLFTWANAGVMREQMCKVVCPYARIQSALIDANTMVVAYDARRGDPRGARPRKADPATLGKGDCVDCGVCVQVCPTGIDIREGLQNECIGCAACIDACDGIMDRMGYAPGLIRYASENGLRNQWSTREVLRRTARPRVVIYTVLLLGVSIGLVTHMALRNPLKIDVTRDRGVLARQVDDGLVENVYTLSLENRSAASHHVRISVSGLEHAFLDSPAELAIGAGDHQRLAVRVRAPANAGHGGATAIEFLVRSTDGAGPHARERSTFLLPR